MLSSVMNSFSLTKPLLYFSQQKQVSSIAFGSPPALATQCPSNSCISLTRDSMYCSNFCTPRPHCSSHSRTCPQLLALPTQPKRQRLTLQSILAYRLRRQVWKERVSRSCSALSRASVVSGQGQLRGCLMACSRVRSGVEKISMNIRSGVRQGGKELLQLRVVGDGVAERRVQRRAPEDAGGRSEGLQVGSDDVLRLVLDGRVDGVDELVLAHLAEGNGLAQRPGLCAQHQLVAPRGLGYLDLRGRPAWDLVGEYAILTVELAQLEVPVEHEVYGLSVFGDLHVIDYQVAGCCDEVESQDVGPFVEGQRCAFVMSGYSERVIEGEQGFLVPSDVANGSFRSRTSHRPIQFKRVAIRCCCQSHQHCQDNPVHVQKIRYSMEVGIVIIVIYITQCLLRADIPLFCRVSGKDCPCPTGTPANSHTGT